MLMKQLANITAQNALRSRTQFMLLILGSVMASYLFLCDAPSQAQAPERPHGQSLERLKVIQAKHEDRMLAIPGVLGIAITHSNGQLFFLVLVERHHQKPDLPAEIERVPVRIEYRDPIQLLDGTPNCGDDNACHNDPQELPVEMGNSGGLSSGISNGTCSLGFKACDLDTHETVFVTNAHCNTNASTCQLAPIDTNAMIWQHPGRGDVTNLNNCFSDGTCANIGSPITGHAAPSCSNSSNNLTDATKVRSSSAQTSIAFRDIGFLQGGAGNPSIGDRVRKSSRTTGDTRGVIYSINGSVHVPPPPKGYCCGPLTMKQVIEWVPDFDIQGGDSGSALLSAEPGSEFQVIGLNFGRVGQFAYANHIDNVLSALNLSLNFAGCFEDCVFTTMASALPDPETAVSLGHRFRDQVLEKSPRGRRFANIYYQITDEAVRIVASNPGLLARTAEIFQRERPLIKALLKDSQVDISRTDLDAIDSLLKEYQKYGSPSLRAALDILRKDLYDREALAEFNVTITTDQCIK